MIQYVLEKHIVHLKFTAMTVFIRPPTLESPPTHDTSVISGTLSGCVQHVSEFITVEGTRYPYYYESPVFKFYGSSFIMRSVPTYYEVCDEDLHWKFFHIFVEVDSGESNMFYATEEVYWGFEGLGRYRLRSRGIVKGGEGIFKGVEGRIKLRGETRFIQDCPAFFVDWVLDAQLRV